MARKTEKGGKFRNVHCRTWNMARKLKMMENGSGKKTAFSTNGAGTTGGYHVEECELIHFYLLVLRSNLSGSRNFT